MIIRHNCFETNSSSTHALCIGKGVRKLKTPMELISKYKYYSYFSDSDALDKQYLPKLKNKEDCVFGGDKMTVNLRRVEDLSREFNIYETFESKCNFIWTTLIYFYRHNGSDWLKDYHKNINIEELFNIFLKELHKYGFKVRFLDIEMKEKEPEVKEKWNSPIILGKMPDEEFIPKYARGKYMYGIQTYGYFPLEELNIIIKNPVLLWNLLLGNSKIYTGSDEEDTFEDLDFSYYYYKLVGGSDWGECMTDNFFSFANRHKIPKLIGSYINGNYETKIYEDGTRTRELLNKETFYDQGIFKSDVFKEKEIDLMKPEFPENIDLKITNYCKNNCKYCYAKSNKNGRHADKAFVKRLINSMHPYTEVALGGGNTLAYPDLVEILEFAKSKNVICNITVKDVDIIKNEKLINDLYDLELIRSIGVSPTTIKTLKEAHDILGNNNFVLHLILGIHGKDFLNKLKRENLYNVERILFLGYKEIGLGEEFYKENKDVIDKKINEIKNIKSIKLPIETISFDNLAINQLNLNTLEEFDMLYQGEDGKFSFYIDAVDKLYAKSSLASDKEKDTICKLDVQGCYEFLNKY